MAGAPQDPSIQVTTHGRGLRRLPAVSEGAAAAIRAPWRASVVRWRSGAERRSRPRGRRASSASAAGLTHHRRRSATDPSVYADMARPRISITCAGLWDTKHAHHKPQVTFCRTFPRLLQYKHTQTRMHPGKMVEKGKKRCSFRNRFWKQVPTYSENKIKLTNVV